LEKREWGRVVQLKFKAEIFLLLLAIIFFVVSSFFYSYEPAGEGLAFALGHSAYRDFAISFVGFGSILMVAATISYSKRSKTPV
jgi:hypothetical protein